MGSLHGFEIDCDRQLSRLSPAVGPLGTVQVRTAEQSPLEEHCELLHLVSDARGNPSAAVGRSSHGLVTWHADAGSFLIDGGGGRIDYRSEDASAQLGAARWEDRLGSTAVSLLAGERGGLPLHASAVSVAGQGLVICGVTGRGKSTLAAALVSRGHEAVAEDGVVVSFDGDRPLVWPGLGGTLITTEAAKAIGFAGSMSSRTDPRGRLLLEAARTVDGATPVAAIAILMERAGADVVLARADAAKGHRELLAHVLPAARGSTAFGSAARVVERVPVAMLTAPESLDSLGAASEALESHAKSDSFSTITRLDRVRTQPPDR